MDLMGKKKQRKQSLEGEGKVPLVWSVHAKLQQRPTIVGFVFMWIQAGQKLDQHTRS